MAKHRLKLKQIHCLKHLQRAFDLLDELHGVGCERDKAGNRELHFSDYCKLQLLYIWNPLIESIADLQKAAGLSNVAKKLGIKRFSAGSFSESVRVFDPELLKPIIAELAGELIPTAADPRLGEFKAALTLVDGTVVRGLARLAKAAGGWCEDGLSDTRFCTAKDGRGLYGWRLHTQLDLATFTPLYMQRTGARSVGASREANVLRANLGSDRCYVGDGSFADRTLFDEIVAAGSSYVIRLREDSVFNVLEERELSQHALDQGVVRDAIVRPGKADSASVNHAVRLVAVQVQPHSRRTRSGFVESDLLLIATNLVDLPAELVSLIYSYRYTIELFFRVFKQLLGMRHLLSQRKEGIDIQIHCTLIVCILIQLIGGKKPNKAMRNVVGWYLLGLAPVQDVIDFVNKPDNTGVKLRAKDALWKKLGY